jgi:hypothetical protein
MEGRGVTNSANFEHRLPKGRHRLIREFCDLIETERWSAAYICREAGIAKGSINRWRAQTVPVISSFEAALNVMGYELTIRFKGRRGEET